MRAVIAVMLVAAACFDRPDYTNTTFKCDASHSCPTGQMCKGSLCLYVSSTYDGVVCGNGTCGVGSNSDRPQCCFNGVVSACIGATAECTGGGAETISALCDDAADCSAGTACCPGVVGPASCSREDCDDRLCRTNDDCMNYPFCCPDFTRPGPFLRCSQTICGM